MVGGFRLKTRLGSGILLCLVSWGLLATETHAILGHTHGELKGANWFLENGAGPRGSQLASLKGDDQDPNCNLCIYYRLLRYSLIPAIACPVDSFFVVQAITVRRICLVQACTPHEENRGPPTV